MKQLIESMVKFLGEDVKLATFDNIGYLVINDICGLDDEFEGIPHKFINFEGVKALIAWIKANATGFDKYGTYYFEDGFELTLDYASSDI